MSRRDRYYNFTTIFLVLGFFPRNFFEELNNTKRDNDDCNKSNGANKRARPCELYQVAPVTCACLPAMQRVYLGHCLRAFCPVEHRPTAEPHTRFIEGESFLSNFKPMQILGPKRYKWNNRNFILFFKEIK